MGSSATHLLLSAYNDYEVVIISRYLFFEKSSRFKEFLDACENFQKRNPKRRVISLAKLDFSMSFLKGRDQKRLERQYIELNTMFFEESLKKAGATFVTCGNYIVIKSEDGTNSFELFERFLNKGALILFPSDVFVTNISSSLILTPYCDFNECASACARIERLIY